MTRCMAISRDQQAARGSWILGQQQRILATFGSNDNHLFRTGASLNAKPADSRGPDG
jgi:hypothetical protein